MKQLTMKQAMKYTGISRPTLSKLLDTGKLPGEKIGDNTNPWLIPADEVERLRKERVSWLLERMQAISTPVPTA